jgi:hypothetical protein
MTSNAIDNIVNKIEEKKLKSIYKEYSNVIDIISRFVIKKKLILYGGLVINLALPKKYRFYKDYTINDFDCFSKNQLRDSLELAKIIKKNNYKFIKIRKAKHDGTLKIYVYGKQIFDITIMPALQYNKLLKYTKKPENKLKYYNEKYNIIPIEYIKQNLYFELSRPEQSGWRWEKIYNRLNLINKFYPSNKNNVIIKKCLCIKPLYKDVTELLLNHIKDNKYPVIDSYPLKIYKKSDCCFRLSKSSQYITILSNIYEKTKNDIIKILKANLSKKDFKISVNHNDVNMYNIYASYTIKIIDNKTEEEFNIIKIIYNKNECFSINEKDGFFTGSIDTNLYFLYVDYIKNKIYLNREEEASENLYYINQYENYIKNNIKYDVKKRLKSNCYGVIDNKNDIKRLWKQKLTIKYFS